MDSHDLTSDCSTPRVTANDLAVAVPAPEVPAGAAVVVVDWSVDEVTALLGGVPRLPFLLGFPAALAGGDDGALERTGGEVPRFAR